MREDLQSKLKSYLLAKTLLGTKVTGEVTLRDSKYRSAPTYFKTSPSYARTSPLGNAKRKTIEAIVASSLSLNIINKARFNILRDKFKTRTTGAGNTINSVTE